MYLYIIVCMYSVLPWSTYAWHRTTKCSRKHVNLFTQLLFLCWENCWHFSRIPYIAINYDQHAVNRCIFWTYSLPVTNFVPCDQYFPNHQLHQLHSVFGDHNLLSRYVRSTILNSTWLRPYAISHHVPGSFLSV